MTTLSSTVDLSAADTYSDWVDVTNVNGVGYTFLASSSGTWAGTLTVQYKKPGEADSTAVDIEAFTANFVKKGDLGAGGLVARVGFKTGEYTSGTASVIIKSA